MKKHYFSILSYLILILISSTVFSRDIKKDYHESFEVKSGDILYLNQGDGDVVITSWDKDVVDIEVHFSANVFALGSGEYEFDIKFDQQGNEIEVSEFFKNNHRIGIRGVSIDRYEYLIHAPKYLLLNLNGDDGDIEIQDMGANINCRLSDGDLEINNVTAGLIKLNLKDGSLKMRNIEAELDIKMDDGDVSISDYTGEDCMVDIEDGQLDIERASGNFDINSDDGDVELRHLTVGTLKATSSDGDIYIDLLETAAPDIKIRTDDGKVVVDIDENISAEVEIETGDGQIKTDLSNPDYEKKKRNYYLAEIHGGEGRIHIRTNDGEVILREVN